MPKARKLIEIDPDEISLVDAGANRKVFAIVKRSIPMNKMIAAFAALLAAAFTEPMKKNAGAIPESEAAGLTGALEAFAKYKDDLPDDIVEAAQTLAKAAIPSGPPAADGAELPIDIEKIGARLSKATKEELMKIKAVVDRMLEADKADDAPVKKYDGLPPEIAARLKKQDADEAAALALKKTADDTERAADKAAIKDLKDRLEKVEKARGIKKSADVDGAEDKGSEKTEKKGPLWPSLAEPED